MANMVELINNELVEAFNNILRIESHALKNASYKDLSMTEIHTIEVISINKARTMSEVASDLNVTLGTLTTAINKLVRKKYVVRYRDMEDRRIVRIKLTEKGKEVYKAHKKFHDLMVESMVDDFTKQAEEILASSLQKINDFLKEVYNFSDLNIYVKNRNNENKLREARL